MSGRMIGAKCSSCRREMGEKSAISRREMGAKGAIGRKAPRLPSPVDYESLSVPYGAQSSDQSMQV